MRRRSLTTLVTTATACLATTAAMAVLPGTASAVASAVSGAAASSVKAPARTKIVFKVKHCNGCRIGVQRALESGTTVRPKRPGYWPKRERSVKVHHGRAVLHVPTRYTSGMSFTIDAPWAADITNAVTNIVVGYPGVPANARVGKKHARHARHATACWAGTHRAKVVFHLRVAKVRGKVLGGGHGQTPLAWTNPTKRTVPGTANRTWRGIIGNQDAYYC